MVKSDIRVYSRAEIRKMIERGEVREAPADAPEIELDEDFWANARIVETRARPKPSVHLRLDAETLEAFRADGRGHLTRMANVLKAYAQTLRGRQSKSMSGQKQR